MQRRSGEKKRCLGQNVSLMVIDLIPWSGGKSGRRDYFFFLFIFSSEHEKEIQKHIPVLLCFAFLQFSGLALAFSSPSTSIRTYKTQGRSGQNCRQFSLDKTFLGSSKKEQINIKFLNTQGKINREIIFPAMLVL